MGLLEFNKLPINTLVGADWKTFKAITAGSASQIEHNQIDMVFFLRDPLSPKVHEPDVNNVIHLCDIYNIPFATNLATAELLIKALDRGDLEWREVLKKEGTDIDE